MQSYTIMGIVLGLLFLYSIRKVIDFKRIGFKGTVALSIFSCILGVIAVFVFIRYLFYLFRYLIIGLIIAVLIWLLFHKNRKGKD